MDKRLIPQKLGGTLSAIPSKSHAQRLLLCAALADFPSKITCNGTSADIQTTLSALTAMGAIFSHESDQIIVTPIQAPPQTLTLDCGESGATFRFMLPVVAALGIDTTFILHGRLAQRPIAPLWNALEQHGCTLSRPTPSTLRCRGKLQGGSFEIAGNISSQFISGLLFALPLLSTPSNIMLTSPLESASYVSMTIAALSQHGIDVIQGEACYRFDAESHYHHCDTVVEGDWSGAAFWLCAGAISTPITVLGLRPDSLQGDREILQILKKFGAKVDIEDGKITVSPALLHGICIDARNIPDLVPPMAAVAACAEGTTQIVGASRLRAKESDRLSAIVQVLSALGIKATQTPNGLEIVGGKLHGGTVSAHNDHRIAMMAALLSAACTDPIELQNAEAVNKSYPTFWTDYQEVSL